MKVQLRAYGKAQTAAIPGYREELQRRHRYEAALSCFVISVSQYQAAFVLAGRGLLSPLAQMQHQ
jgi:hypothetical protein